MQLLVAKQNQADVRPGLVGWLKELNKVFNTQCLGSVVPRQCFAAHGTHTILSNTLKILTCFFLDCDKCILPPCSFQYAKAEGELSEYLQKNGLTF